MKDLYIVICLLSKASNTFSTIHSADRIHVPVLLLSVPTSELIYQLHFFGKK